LTFLDGQDIVRFSVTNRAFYNLYNESALLQSLLQLDIFSAEACISPPNIGSRKRLPYMIARESMWNRISRLPELALIHRRVAGSPEKFYNFDEGVL